MKLLLDMNLSPRWQNYLEADGFAAVHWSQIGRPDAKDRDIVDYARKNELVILTHDFDFGQILFQQGQKKPSVVHIRCDNLNPDVIGKQVCAALRQKQVELAAGAIVIVDPRRVRARFLPVKGRSL